MEIASSILNAENYADITRKLEESEQTTSALLNTPYGLSIIIDISGKILQLSKAMAAKLKIAPQKAIGHLLWDTMPKEFSRINKEYISEAIRFRTPVHFEGICMDRWYDYIIYPIIDSNGKAIKIVILCRDISVRKKALNSLKAANQKLKEEHQALVEKNIALKELLAHIDEEKKLINQNLHANIEQSITPLIRKLEENCEGRASQYFSLLKSNLNRIISPFIKNIEKTFGHLSPRELELCNYLREGMSTKEIANLLCVSEDTVKNQRKNIRKKIGIAGDKINLVTFLQEVDEPCRPELHQRGYEI